MKSLNHLTDPELLVALLNEDSEAAFAQVYARYFDRLYSHATGMLDDEDAAADVVQDVFAYLWKHRNRDIQTSLPAYLYSATRHGVLKVIRRSHVANRFREHIRQLSDQTLPQTDDLTRERELRALIDSAVDELPNRVREVFKLKYEQGLSNAEVADQLGVSENTVKNQASQAVKTLRQTLGKTFFLLFFNIL